MLRKFLLIGVFTLCATLYAYGPEWSSASAQTPNQSIPNVSDIGDATLIEGVLSDTPQGNFTPGQPLTLNVDYTNNTDSRLESPTVSVALPEGVTPVDGSGWQNAGEGPDGTTLYTFDPENSADALGSVPKGSTVSAPLPVDIAETAGSAPIIIGTRLDAYDGSQEPGERLSAIIGEMEILPVLSLPENILSLGSLDDTTIPTTTAEIQFSEPTAESAPPTVNTETGEVVVPVEFTNTSGGVLENTLLAVEIPDGVELPAGSGWTEETITDADGNEQRIAVLNVGSLDPGESINVPFPLLGNNVNIGDTLTIPTVLTANDGVVQLRGEVAATLQEVLVPTNLAEISEPENNALLYLPIIRQ